MYRPLAKANVQGVYNGAGITTIACDPSRRLNLELTGMDFACIVLGMARTTKIHIFADKQEAIKFAQKLYLAWELRNQIELAMEAGWISDN